MKTLIHRSLSLLLTLFKARSELVWLMGIQYVLTETVTIIIGGCNT